MNFCLLFCNLCIEKLTNFSHLVKTMNKKYFQLCVRCPFPYGAQCPWLARFITQILNIYYVPGSIQDHWVHQWSQWTNHTCQCEANSIIEKTGNKYIKYFYYVRRSHLLFRKVEQKYLLWGRGEFVAFS